MYVDVYMVDKRMESTKKYKHNQELKKRLKSIYIIAKITNIYRVNFTHKNVSWDLQKPRLFEDIQMFHVSLSFGN